MSSLQPKLVKYSVCALDCPDTCSLQVTIEDGRATQLRGDPAHPVTKGFLCAKVARYLERQYSGDRLLYPQRRIGEKGEGRFERISWDDALDITADRLSRIAREYGPEAVLPFSYGGNTGLLNGAGMDRRFFHRFGASRLDRTICSTAGTEALERTLGSRYGVDPELFPEARLIIAWGSNLCGGNVHLWPFIVEARRRGARFYVIDPVHTKTGERADRHFPIYPGSDQALALGLAHVILTEGLEDTSYIAGNTEGLQLLRERISVWTPDRVATLTGIPAPEIVALAREYAATRPAVIRLGYGVQRSERGGAAVEAISMLPVLTGAWRHAGGGLLLTTSGAFRLNYPALERADLQFRSPLGREARLVNMSLLGEALETLDSPPIRAIFVYNCNPAAVAPNQSRVLAGLARPDLFTVVSEQFLTDTARYADVLLPATTFLENTDLYTSYGHYYLQFARPALAPVGEAKSNVELFRLLAERMGFNEHSLRASEDDLIQDVLASGHSFLKGLNLDRLETERFLRLSLTSEGEPFLPYADGSFGSLSGKYHIDSACLDYVPPIESRCGDPGLRRRFPLEFISLKSEEGHNSTFSNRPEVDARCWLLDIHPSDAQERDIVAGSLVRVFNDRGSCQYRARLDPALRPGLVAARATRWGAGNANAVTSDRLTDMGGGAVFYSCLVQLEPVQDS